MGHHKDKMIRRDKRWIAPSEFRLDQVFDLTLPAVQVHLAPQLAAALARPSEADRPQLQTLGQRLKQSGARGIIVPSWRGTGTLNLVILDSEIEGGPPEGPAEGGGGGTNP